MAGGQDPERFWHTTLRLQDIILRGVQKITERERDIARFGAFQAGSLVHIALHDPKHFPTFEKYWGLKPRERRQAPEQMRAMMIAFTAANGGKVNL